MTATSKILVYGFGNPGRQDDGLGIQLVHELEEWASSNGLTHIHFDTNYQLNIEDAEVISKYDLVIFADASVEDLENGWGVSRLEGEKDLAFTTHSASPGYVVHLCSVLFSIKPESYLIHIKGYEWEFRQGLSERACKNLSKAIHLMKQILSAEDFSKDGIIQNSELIIHN